MRNFESATNENLCIALCAFRLDKDCSVETFVDIVTEVQRRLEEKVTTRAVSDELKKWCTERYVATNHNYFLEMSDKMNELGVWEKNNET